MKKQILCIVGPSGAGKTEIAKWLMENDTRFQKVKTATTRTPRENESNADYFFKDEKTFEQEEKDGLFLETSIYAGKKYGTPKVSVESIIEDGNIAIVPIDMNGAMAYKNYYGDIVSIVFVYREKRTIIEAIMQRNIPIEEKSKRILQLDKEYQNMTYCDRCVINNTTIEDAAKVVSGFVNL